MGLAARHLLSIFVTRFLWVLAFLLVFAALTSVVGFLARHPHVPLPALLGAVPDLVLMLLPLALPVAALAGGILFVAEVRRQQGFLWIEAAGRDPRRLLVPVLLAGVALSTLSWWLEARVLPRARHGALETFAAISDSPLSLGLRLAEDPRLLPGYVVAFTGTEEGRIEGFSLASRGDPPATALTAAAADATVLPGGVFLELRLSRGRLLRREADGDLALNVAFRTMSVWLDLDRLLGTSKRSILDLSYYTNPELDLLPEQVRQLTRRGIGVGRKTRGKLTRIDATKRMRAQSGLLSLLFLLLVVVFLGTHRGSRGRRRAALVAAFCLGVVLPAWLVLGVRVRAAEPPGPLLLWAPTILAGGAAALGAVLPLLRRGAGR